MNSPLWQWPVVALVTYHGTNDDTLKVFGQRFGFVDVQRVGPTITQVSTRTDLHLGPLGVYRAPFPAIVGSALFFALLLASCLAVLVIFHARNRRKLS